MSGVHKNTEISIFSYHRPFIRLTCWLASRPAPNSDSDTHMVMMTASVMVRFCRKPLPVSEKIWRKRISSSPRRFGARRPGRRRSGPHRFGFHRLDPGRFGGGRAVQVGVSSRSRRSLVAVDAAALVTDHRPVVQLDDPLTH